MYIISLDYILANTNAADTPIKPKNGAESGQHVTLLSNNTLNISLPVWMKSMNYIYIYIWIIFCESEIEWYYCGKLIDIILSYTVNDNFVFSMMGAVHHTVIPVTTTTPIAYLNPETCSIGLRSVQYKRIWWEPEPDEPTRRNKIIFFNSGVGVQEISDLGW